QSAGKQQTAQSVFHDVLPLGSLSRLPGPAGSGRGTVLVKDATASPHSKARQIFVTFHDTLPSRGPTQPTIGLTVISGYGASRCSRASRRRSVDRTGSGHSVRGARTGSIAPKPTFAPARRRSGKQSSEQRHVNLQRLGVAAAVASAGDESDLIWREFGG